MSDKKKKLSPEELKNVCGGAIIVIGESTAYCNKCGKNVTVSETTDGKYCKECGSKIQ